MIVDDFYFVGIAITPDKADSPLVIDSDTVLPFSASFERFNTVAWKYSKVAKRYGSGEHFELAPGNSLDGTKSPGRPEMEKGFRLLAAKALNHDYPVVRVT